MKSAGLQQIHLFLQGTAGGTFPAYLYGRFLTSAHLLQVSLNVSIPNDIDAWTKEIWENLNEQNKISIYVRFTDLKTGAVENRMINKNVLLVGRTGRKEFLANERI